jgi:energy-coupling factor transport system ATP-binding protein
VFAVVRELNQELGMTIVMASHAAEEMAQYADRLALLGDGQLLAIGSPDDVYADVEALVAHSLRPPQVAQTFYLIQEKGIPVAKIPTRLDKGLRQLEGLHSTCSATVPKLAAAPAKPEAEPVLSVKDLVHTYPDGTEALQGVSLGIYEGEYALIIGQNGAGKSTLVKHFLNILKPTAGSVKVGGVETAELSVSDLARRIGYIAQNPDNQIFSNTVGQEVSFALENLKYPKEEVEERTTESLKSMGLLELRDAHPLSLPKGDRARVVIAAILAMRPEIIIFDEPTTGQDYRGAGYILDISKQLHSMGKTVVVITHHLYLMADYAERTIVMGKGTLLLDAPIREAYHQTELLQSTFLTPPQSVFLAQHLASLNGGEYPLLTPAEVASCFEPLGERSLT